LAGTLVAAATLRGWDLVRAVFFCDADFAVPDCLADDFCALVGLAVDF